MAMFSNIRSCSDTDTIDIKTYAVPLLDLSSKVK